MNQQLKDKLVEFLEYAAQREEDSDQTSDHYVKWARELADEVKREKLDA